MKKTKAKFKAGDQVCFTYSMFNDSVYWVVVKAKPDSRGQIVVVNARTGEYAIVYQSDLRWRT